MPESDYEELKGLAADENVSVSEYVRRLIAEDKYRKSQFRSGTDENRCSETQANYLDSLLTAVQV